MPKRRDLRSICVLGSGPIVIGQACEFDYAGCQALKALRAEGYRTIVVNSNPATIMTDPEFADRTYIEPLDPERVALVLRRERPDAVLSTVGGQTALNIASALASNGILDELGIELIGASFDVIRRAEDRDLFRATVESVGLQTPAGRIVAGLDGLSGIPVPAVVRPAFTLGGHGGGFVETHDQLRAQVERGLRESPIGQVLVEESLRGWDEFELELMRDRADNVVVVCSIENLDPMGTHTGDSVTVAPQMTLSDQAFQELRDAALAVIRAVGVETGGANIQFARSRTTGELRVIELNPRVSRSSALASKATGYPIAKVAAKLAVGYTLDEIPNDLTGTTPASFEPTLDYVVVKVPRFAFEKFPGASTELGTQMKSVGEAMGIGRTFSEAFLKALRSRELDAEAVLPTWATDEHVPDGVHPWFREQLEQARRVLSTDVELLALKRAGWSDSDIAASRGTSESAIREERWRTEIRPGFHVVDSCAGEVDAHSNYLYSTWGERSEAEPSTRPTIVILGSGPNRIGQGIEFDYCCVHAVSAFRSLGYETVMVNCNPETVSTDYEASDRLYFEPLRIEEVLEILQRERPIGVVTQFGGQTPLRLAPEIQRAGYSILGTQPEAIDLAEDRERFASLCEELEIRIPPWGIASNAAEAIRIADAVGYPVVVRPSYVLGGRAMRVCWSAGELRRALSGSSGKGALVDRFLANAIEVDVDALCDGSDTYIAAIMEHVEEAGVHSGDSSCVIPPHTLSAERRREIALAVRRIARALGVVGLVNVQFALHEHTLYVLEANPRASRTIPFASKARGLNLVEAACRLAAGADLASLRLPPEEECSDVSVKAAVLPFDRLPGSDPLLGPEMRSTGEVMATAAGFESAYAMAERAAGRPLPTIGRALVGATRTGLHDTVALVAALVGYGFDIVTPRRTAAALVAAGVDAKRLLSVEADEGVDLVRRRLVDLVIVAPGSDEAWQRTARRAALDHRIPLFTSPAGARAAVAAAARGESETPISLQERHRPPTPVHRPIVATGGGPR